MMDSVNVQEYSARAQQAQQARVLKLDDLINTALRAYLRLRVLIVFTLNPKIPIKKLASLNRTRAYTIIMVNVFSHDHVDDLPDLAPAIPEPALVDENEELEEEEEEFEEEEPQEEEEDMEVDVGEEENEPELIFPYVEADSLNPPPPASNSESEDVVEVEDMVEPEDEAVPNS
ncbi:hypothetical protein Tco_0425704, partial [Tanacetum coccineum]